VGSGVLEGAKVGSAAVDGDGVRVLVRVGTAVDGKAQETIKSDSAIKANAVLIRLLFSPMISEQNSSHR
jgi:hypothetical protein